MGLRILSIFQPAISIGNVGQLAIDLLIYNLDFKRVGYLYDSSILPLVGNDPFTSPKTPEGNLVTSAEGAVCSSPTGLSK
jgi:proteasome assembly chaperone 2